MTYLIFKLTIANFYGFIGAYIAAYINDFRIVDELFCYEYIPVAKFRFFCLRKSNPNKLIRKITRDREILAGICFLFYETIMIIFLFISELLRISSNISENAFLILIIMILFAQLYFESSISNRCITLVKTIRKTLDVTEYNLEKCAKKIISAKFKDKKDYTIKKTQQNSFWYERTEYQLYVESQYIQTLVKQQKYRYSSLIENKWH